VFGAIVNLPDYRKEAGALEAAERIFNGRRGRRDGDRKRRDAIASTQELKRGSEEAVREHGHWNTPE